MGFTPYEMVDPITGNQWKTIGGRREFRRNRFNEDRIESLLGQRSVLVLTSWLRTFRMTAKTGSATKMVPIESKDTPLVKSPPITVDMVPKSSLVEVGTTFYTRRDTVKESNDKT